VCLTAHEWSRSADCCELWGVIPKYCSSPSGQPRMHLHCPDLRLVARLEISPAEKSSKHPGTQPQAMEPRSTWSPAQTPQPAGCANRPDDLSIETKPEGGLGSNPNRGGAQTTSIGSHRTIFLRVATNLNTEVIGGVGPTLSLDCNIKDAVSKMPTAVLQSGNGNRASQHLCHGF
jgi:hypothetical protein